LIAELQRRRVIRALVGYGIGAFAVLQIVEPIMHGFHWPDAVLTYIVAALAIGFPIVVSLAWIFDVNAGRVERTGPAAGLGGARLAAILVGIGVLAAAPGTIWYFFVRKPAQPAPGAGDVATAPSIAVLPLVNLSSDKEQEYFSDGLTEELLNLLAKVPGLHVAARTSAFAFKGKNVKMSEIGQELGVATLLEGSVRKSGDQVRITTQLINAGDGYHLWSETYDRKLTDIFAVQDEIARAVVGALKLKLLPAAHEERRTVNPEAHNQYLLGRAFLARGSGDAYGRAVQALRKSVDLDPGYAPAWADLAWALFWEADQGAADPKVGWLPKAEAAAEKAIALAPSLADGYAVRGGLRWAILHDWAGAQADLEHARTLNPGGPAILQQNGSLLGALGRLPESIAFLQQAALLDPLSADIKMRLSEIYLGAGRLDLSEEAATRALEISPEHGRAARDLGFAMLLQNRLPEARAAFHRSSNPLFVGMGDVMVEHTLGHAAESRRALDGILAQPNVLSGSYQVAQAYAWRSETDRAFEWLERAVEQRDAGLTHLKSDPLLRGIRGDPRFTALLKKMNLPLD